MNKHIYKILMLTLYTLSLGVFGILPGYAITINEAQKLLASDGVARDFFGSSVSISGDTAMIGASGDDDNGDRSGSVYVFVRDGAGVWNEQQELAASDGAAIDHFGEAVSLSEDTTVIASTGDGDNGILSGSAYVFVRDGTGAWSEQQKLTASDGRSVHFFGNSVSISGDTIVIGANGDRDNGRNAGSAYVFVRDGSGVWSEQQKLTASDGAAGDAFGLSVSISADTAVIGAPGNNGSIYVFVRDGAGMWSEQQKLNPGDGTAAGFGQSVSISGDAAVIGANSDDDNGDRSGSAYVFVRDSTGVWHEQQKLLASDGRAVDFFGSSVSIFGDKAVIAATGDSDNGSSSGSTYVFVRDGSGVWSEQQKLIASDGAPVDSLGGSVSLSGDTVVIGAGGDDDNGDQSGSAYVFEPSDPDNNLLTIEKLINHRIRKTPDKAAELLVGTRYRTDYKVTNNSPNRIYRVRVFEDNQLVCNLYSLMPGQSKQPSSCANFQDVLVGRNNVRARVTAKVSGSNQDLAAQTNAYYTGFGNVAGRLSVKHHMNGNNGDKMATAVEVNGNQVEIVFRVKNTGSIKLYRVKTYHDPVSPIDSGWQQQCDIGTLMPGEVRYCQRTISVPEAGLNKAFGRAQGEDANVNPRGFVNAANPTYFNVLLP